MTSLPAEVYRVFRRAGQEALAGKPELVDGHVIAAVSGGIDSMVLLRFLVWLQSQVDFSLTVAHLDHGLRDTSGADADLVCSYASRFGLHVDVLCEDIASRARREKQGIEAAGRAARYAFFQQLAKRKRGYPRSHESKEASHVYIALAHHRQDQAETILLNITRGSGLSGLTGMSSLAGDRWRPLLDLGKNDIRIAANALQIPFAEDESNQSDDFLRNRLRNELIPTWSALASHDITDKLAALAEKLRAEEEVVQVVANEMLTKASLDDGSLYVQPLVGRPIALIRRVLELSFRARTDGQMLLASHTVRLTDAIASGQKQPLTIDLPNNVRAELLHGILRFVTD